MAEDIREGLDSSSSLPWFLAGVAIGAAAALLLAPRSGKQTREAVAGSGKEMVDRSREFYDRGRHMIDDAAELFERGRKLVRG